MPTRETHFLYPAALFASKDPVTVSTILGSCVAVCFFDKAKNIGGINHFMLPLWNGQGLESPKYGNVAIRKLLQKMEALGCRKEDLVAKIFGGGGQRNIQTAEDELKNLGIPIIARSTGGKNGRKLEFDTETGAVRQRLIQKTM